MYETCMECGRPKPRPVGRPPAVELGHVLDTIYQAGQASIFELARLLDVSRPTAKRYALRLASDGLVTMKDGPRGAVIVRAARANNTCNDN